jgi:phosphoglucosamine mutase
LKLFGTDGVRGLAGDKITAILALELAMAAGIYFRKTSRTNKILVGKDTRRSGYMIENALVSGLTAVGFDVIQIGPMPTPAVAFLTESMRCDAGIMLSASHNPYEDNGIKFFNQFGHKLDEKQESAIEKIFFDKELIKKSQCIGKKIGSSKRIDDVQGRYIEAIKSGFDSSVSLHQIRVVLDTANGAAYKVAPTILQELDADVIVVNNTPNGSNINDECGALHPNRVAQNVIKYRADIGIALDGDADRLVVIDENGGVIDGNKLIAALTYYLHTNGKLKNSGCVSTIMANQALEDYLSKFGIKLHRTNVGDKYVVEKMRSSGINFGGEESGHIILSDYAKTGDGLLSALQVLEMLVKSGKKASEILNPFELYPSKSLNLNIKEKIPLESIKPLAKIQKELQSKGLRDVIRYSGTENKLRVLIEGKDIVEIENYMIILEELFNKELK